MVARSKDGVCAKALVRCFHDIETGHESLSSVRHLGSMLLSICDSGTFNMLLGYV